MTKLAMPILVPQAATETWDALIDAIRLYAGHGSRWLKKDRRTVDRAERLWRMLSYVHAPQRWTAQDLLDLVGDRPDGRPDPAFVSECEAAAENFAEIGLADHAELSLAWTRFIAGIDWGRIGPKDPETGAIPVPELYQTAIDEFFEVQTLLRDRVDLGSVLLALVEERREVHVLSASAYRQAMVDLACHSRRFEAMADALAVGKVEGLPRTTGARGRALTQAESTVGAALFLTFGAPRDEGGWTDILYGAEGFWALDLPAEGSDATAQLYRWPGGTPMPLSEVAAPQPGDPVPPIERGFHTAVRKAAFPREDGWRGKVLNWPFVGKVLEPLIQLLEPVSLFRLHRGVAGWGVSDIYVRETLLDLSRALGIFGLVIWAIWLEREILGGPEPAWVFPLVEAIMWTALALSACSVLHATIKVVAVISGSWARATGRGCRGRIDLPETGHDNWILRRIRAMNRVTSEP